MPKSKWADGAPAVPAEPYRYSMHVKHTTSGDRYVVRQTVAGSMCGAGKAVAEFGTRREAVRFARLCRMCDRAELN